MERIRAHGSGRRMKREDVKNQYTVSEFKKDRSMLHGESTAESCAGIRCGSMKVRGSS